MLRDFYKLLPLLAMSNDKSFYVYKFKSILSKLIFMLLISQTHELLIKFFLVLNPKYVNHEHLKHFNIFQIPLLSIKKAM